MGSDKNMFGRESFTVYVKVPCKDCDQRTPTCHGNCENYKEYRAIVSDKGDFIRKHKYDSWVHDDRKRFRKEWIKKNTK